MQIKGYTLLEMCLILCAISVFLLLTPALFRTQAVLNFESERIVQLIKYAQGLALTQRREVDVHIMRQNIKIDEKQYAFDPLVVCDEYIFYFNGKGNINMANTITCSYYGWQKQIVLNLGNGNVYVKE